MPNSLAKQPLLDTKPVSFDVTNPTLPFFFSIWVIMLKQHMWPSTRLADGFSKMFRMSNKFQDIAVRGLREEHVDR